MANSDYKQELEELIFLCDIMLFGEDVTNG